MPGALAVFFDHSEILTVGLVNAALTAMAVGELCFSFKKLRMRYCRVMMPESFTNKPSFLQVYRASPFFRWQAGIDALGELQAVRLCPDARGAGTQAPTALGLLATSQSYTGFNSAASAAAHSVGWRASARLSNAMTRVSLSSNRNCKMSASPDEGWSLHLLERRGVWRPGL